MISALRLVAFAAALAAPAAAQHSVGTLVHCPAVRSSDAPCLWAGEDGELVDARALREVMLQRHLVSFQDLQQASRNLEEHMSYIEEVNAYAARMGHAFSYSMGVSERHLSEPSRRKLLPEMLVHREMRARARRLASMASMATNSSTPAGASASDTLNWCSTANSKGYDICSAVKSQQNCGSCWAFAAADAIETAVVLAANQSAAVALSPQQFLTCSTRETTQTFEYCWAANGVSGASWIDTEIKWESQNEGCNGGMTHGAFMDAAWYSWGLLTELDMPYDDSASADVTSSNASCTVSSGNAAASITGWAQAMGADCSASSDANALLKTALASQPIAVAINSEDPFGDYAGGFYTCPNNGELASKDNVNHALVLVGYGTDAANGDYWILKNSYGSSWGASGYMKLLADSKVNCGLNVFPVIPTGAAAGAAANSSVDGGGDKVFVGLSVAAWIAVAAATTIFTVVSTSVGIVVSTRKLQKLREQSSGTVYLTRTPNGGQR